MRLTCACCHVALGTQVGNQMFWQWVNQSYNAAFNYGNRNATLQTNWRSLAGASASACVSGPLFHPHI